MRLKRGPWRRVPSWENERGAWTTIDLSTLPTITRAVRRATGSPRGANVWPTRVTSGRGL